MKKQHVVLALALLALAGCKDEHDSARAAGSADAPAGQQAIQATAPRMSMQPTDARIAGLAARTTDCNIESANGEGFEPQAPVVSRAGSILVSGWLIDAASKTVPADVVLRVETESGDKAWEQKVSEWGDRGDVVTTHGDVAAYQKSGFQAALELADLPPGAYNVYLAYGDAGKQGACAVGRKFNLN